jgi:hypothetical protein
MRMMMIRPAIALDPLRFGRRLPRLGDEAGQSPALVDDLKLFGTTFAIGFLFVSVLIF